MNNIARMQDMLEQMGLDAVLVTGEKNQRYAAGFPFTDGYVLVARHRAWLITDSRYIEAARLAVPESVSTRPWRWSRRPWPRPAWRSWAWRRRS